MPRELLDLYPSYGSNYIGLSGIQPTYWVCVDSDAMRDYDGLHKVAAGARTAYLLAAPARELPISELPNARPIYRDTDAFWREYFVSGCTSLYVMLKLAYYDGFDKVLLWGADFDSKWRHFTEDYPVNPLGNVTLIRHNDAIAHLKIASTVYKNAGKRIVNYSYPSELDEIFERDDL